MKWYEYKMEVDDLHASDDLKAKLMAMQNQAAPASTPPEKLAAPPAARPARKKPIRFPARRLFGLAACLALCVIVGGSAFSVLQFGAGSSNSVSVLSDQPISRAAVGGAADTALYAMASSPEAAAYGGENSAVLLTGGEAENTTRTDSTKIIYTANLSLESKDYDTAVDALNAALSAAGGYLESSSESTSNGSARSLSLTLRVPEDNYRSFLTAAADAGNLVYKSEQADDVTSQYLDLEARLDSLTAQRTRLQELQASAETLSDLLDIESSLSDVQYQLESYQSQLDWYAQQVECCTVYVSLSEVKEYTPADESFVDRITASFRNGWTSFVAGLQQLVVWLIMVWPLLLLLAVLTVGILLWRRRRASRK